MSLPAKAKQLHHWLARKSKDRIKDFLCQRLHVEFNTIGFPLALARRLERGKPIVYADVGAFEGWFCRLVSQYCGIVQAVLVEPMPGRIESLRSEFPPPKHRTFCCAASNHEGVVSFEINEFEASSSMLPMLRELEQVQGTVMQCPPSKTIECPTRTLDSITREAELPAIDLLKIDVQGAEHLVLQGAHATLARTRLLWIEVSFRPLYVGASIFNDLYEQLNDLGFSLVDLEPGFRSQAGELLQADALFIQRQ
jgi:FkbM family methyltransferase